MRWNRNGFDTQQPNPFRISHTNYFGIGQLDFGQVHAFAQNAPFLFGHPLRGERKQFFQLLEG